MAIPYRTNVTIDGTTFKAFSASVSFQMGKDRAGMPQMSSLTSAIKVWVDFHDHHNVSNATLQKLFKLANVVTHDKIKDMKIEFWQDDAHKDALIQYTFKGWISSFHTSNPPNGLNGKGQSSVNHMLVLELQPAMTQENSQDVAIGN